MYSTVLLQWLAFLAAASVAYEVCKVPKSWGLRVARVSKKNLAAVSSGAFPGVFPETSTGGSVSSLTQVGGGQSVAYLPHSAPESVAESTHPPPPAAAPAAPPPPELVPDIEPSEPVAQEEGAVKGYSRTGMPIPPGLKLVPESMFRFSKLLEPKHWAHARIYIQDDWPVATRKPKYIAKLQQPIDLEYFRHTLGSGTYTIRLNDTAIPGDRRTICQCDFVFRDPAYPPKRDLNDVALNDPANKDYRDWLIRDGQLNSKGEIMANVTSGNDAVTLTLAQALIDKNGSSTDPLIQFLMKELADQRKESAELRKQFMDAQTRPVVVAPPAAPPSNDHAFELLKIQLNNANATVTLLQTQAHQLTMRQLENPPGAGGKGMSLKEFLEMEKIVEDRIAKRTPAVSDDDGSWQAVAKSYAPAVIQVAQAFASKLSAPAPAANGAADIGAAGGAVVPSALNGAVALTHEEKELQDIFEECVEMMRSQGSHLVGAMHRNESGEAFARQLAAAVGEPALLSVADYGPETLGAAILEVPELKQQLSGRQAQLVTFIESFCDYADGLRPPEDETPAAPGVPA